MLQKLTSVLSIVILTGLATLSTSTAAETSLEQVLQYALRQDPKLLEARAEQDAAIQNRKASEALHYPTVALTSSQVLAQHHQYESDYRRKTDVGLQGKLNLYSWNGIEASVDRDKEKERFAYYKFFETREELGNIIATHYVTAIHFNEALAIAQNNLKRHKKFLNDLQIVKTYDVGRESEYAQAQSRYLNAESSIIEIERSLQVTMSSLNLYTPKSLSISELVDPFTKQTAEDFFKRYPELKLTMHPGLLAQEAEFDSTVAEIEVTKASTMPQINLEGLASRQDRNLAVTLSWDIFNLPADYNTGHATAKMHAADARTDLILRDITERYETAKIDMVQSQNQARISKRHIEVQKKVAADYAEQFTVSRRSLLEVLDSYAELSRTESTYVNALNQFRTASIAFLLAQAKIANWVGLPDNL